MVDRYATNSGKAHRRPRLIDHRRRVDLSAGPARGWRRGVAPPAYCRWRDGRSARACSARGWRRGVAPPAYCRLAGWSIRAGLPCINGGRSACDKSGQRLPPPLVDRPPWKARPERRSCAGVGVGVCRRPPVAGWRDGRVAWAGRINGGRSACDKSGQGLPPPTVDRPPSKGRPDRRPCPGPELARGAAARRLAVWRAAGRAPARHADDGGAVRITARRGQRAP
jgi:hypothetical protein